MKDLDLPSDRLIIMIQDKNSQIIVPRGDRTVLERDTLIMIQVEHDLKFSEPE